MIPYQLNKKKILNDPVFGFINIPGDFFYDLMQHPWFQRLRRIRQLGMTHLVYPGALHTRFHHAIGALGLMQDAIKVLEGKGQIITPEEKKGACAAIMLHDIGHGPYSHVLEHAVIIGGRHEQLSLLFMERLNRELKGELELAIKIFKNEYPKRFLHQLVSGQLDVDRLDYLKRDSFFTGVSEGVIGTERIIKMMNVVDDNLVVESKGIYSIEKFILARRLMYWQVYLHKTVLSADRILVNLLIRARELVRSGDKLFGTPALLQFLSHNYTIEQIAGNDKLLGAFASLDDDDVAAAVKVWATHPDKVLGEMSRALINRNLFRVELHNEPLNDDYVSQLKSQWIKKNPRHKHLVNYYVFIGNTENHPYNPTEENIRVLVKGSAPRDLIDVSRELNVSVVTKTLTRHYLCYPKYLLDASLYPEWPGPPL